MRILNLFNFTRNDSNLARVADGLIRIQEIIEKYQKDYGIKKPGIVKTNE